MKFKKFFVAVISTGLLISSVFTVLADQTENSGTETMTSSVTQSWLSSFLGEDNSLANSSTFTLAAVPSNQEALNLKFSTLKAELDGNGYGEEYIMSIPDSMSISNSAKDVFNSIYGDLDLSLDNYEIPEGFNPQTMISDTESVLKANYDKFMESDSYQNIYSQISTSTVANDVKAILNNPSNLQSLISSTAAREALLSVYQTSEQSEISKEYENILSAAKDTYNDKVNSLKSNYGISDDDVSKYSDISNIQSITDNLSSSVSYPQIDVSVIADVSEKANEYFGTTASDSLKVLGAMFQINIGDNKNTVDEFFSSYGNNNAMLEEILSKANESNDLISSGVTQIDMDKMDAILQTDAYWISADDVEVQMEKMVSELITTVGVFME